MKMHPSKKMYFIRFGALAFGIAAAIFFGQSNVAAGEETDVGLAGAHTGVVVEILDGHVKFLGLEILPKHKQFEIVNAIPGKSQRQPKTVLPAKAEFTLSERNEVKFIRLISTYTDSVAE